MVTAWGSRQTPPPHSAHRGCDSRSPSPLAQGWCPGSRTHAVCAQVRGPAEQAPVRLSAGAREGPAALTDGGTLLRPQRWAPPRPAPLPLPSHLLHPARWAVLCPPASGSGLSPSEVPASQCDAGAVVGGAQAGVQVSSSPRGFLVCRKVSHPPPTPHPEGEGDSVLCGPQPAQPCWGARTMPGHRPGSGVQSKEDKGLSEGPGAAGRPRPGWGCGRPAL